jgi:branched-subunit amino acid aminotransferase/4-amino-4-deoxychorismate lyase
VRQCVTRRVWLQVREEEVKVEAAVAADEIFTCGTAVVVASVGSLTWKGTQAMSVQS